MTDAVDPIILDLGKKDRHQVKQLSKGKGKLIQAVNTCVESLVQAETIPAERQVVIFVIEKKSKYRPPWDLSHCAS